MRWDCLVLVGALEQGYRDEPFGMFFFRYWLWEELSEDLGLPSPYVPLRGLAVLH